MSTTPSTAAAAGKLLTPAQLEAIPTAPRPPLPQPAGAKSVAPGAAAAAATGVRAGGGGIGLMPGGSGGAAIGAIIGGINIPANFRRGYAEGAANAKRRGVGFLAPVEGASQGVAEAAEGLIFYGPATGAVADWLVDGARSLLPDPPPTPLDPLSITGNQNGQAPGVEYLIGWNIRSSRKNGNGRYDSSIQPTYGLFIGPVTIQRSVSSRGVVTFAAVDAVGNSQGIITNAQDLNIETLELLTERRDGQPDIRPGIVPTPDRRTAAPSTYPATQPFRPTANPPQPIADPYASDRPAPSINPLPALAVGLGALGAAGLGLRNRGRPAIQPAPNQPPIKPPQPTATRSKCPCNAPLAAKLANPAVANGAANGAILAKLQTMQAFAAKAWENSRLNKLVNYLTMISVLHNSAMLSRDVGETIGDLTSNMLAAVGIKDEKGSAIDINELVGASVRNFVQRIVGVDVYNDVSTRWQKASRIISSASMIVYTVRGLHDTSKDVMEWTAENTGKIGNALKRFGVVGERAYPWMSERVKAQDAYRRKFQRVTDGLESLEDTASSLSQVTGDVREIQEEFAELQEQKTAFRELVSVKPPEETATAAPENVPIATAEEQAKTDNEAPEVALTDAIKGN